MDKKEVFNKIDEELASFTVFFTVLIASKNFLLALLFGAIIYFIIYFLTERPVEVQEVQQEVVQKVHKPMKAQHGDIQISQDYMLNLLDSSIFISALKGYGKSVLIYNILVNIHKNFTPSELQVILIDLKEVSYRAFSRSPYVINNTVYTDSSGIDIAEQLLAQRKEEYLKIDSRIVVDNLSKYHKVKSSTQPKFAHVLVIVDEISLLEEKDILRLHNINIVSRSFGITLISATQRSTATLPPKFLSQHNTRCIGYMTTSKEYKYAGLDDVTINDMQAKAGLFAVGGESSGYSITQTYFTSTEQIEKLAQTFETGKEVIQLGTSALQNNVLCLDWFRTLDTKPTIAEIQEHFNCDKPQADKFSKLWRKQ